MAILISDINVEKLALSEPRAGRAGVNIRGLIGGGITFRLGEDLENEIIYEPSAFQGTGQETRLNIMIRTSEEALNALADIERTILPSGYTSSMRDGAIRAKIDVTKAQFYDQAGEEVGQPASYRQRCNAAIEIKGTYQSRQGSGLLLEVTALQLGGVKIPPNPFR